jgi:hypothetical protein
MAKHNLLVFVTFLTLFSTFTNKTLTVQQSEANNTHLTFHTVPTTTTMSNSQDPIRGHGRGRALARGGRGVPRGGRNTVNLPEPPRDGGSPIASHLSTVQDANSSTDDTIELFTQVISTHPASHIITVRQKHVENSCEGLNSHIKLTTTKQSITAFTPDSLDE